MARQLLQRFASPSRSLSLMLHLLGIASFSYNFHFLTLLSTRFSEAYGWHFQFFTIIGLSASLLCFTLGAAADVTMSSSLFQAKNTVSVVAAPVEVVISILYWGISAIDPDLLVQDDLVLPLVADIGFHLAPTILLTLDFVLFSPPWTISAYRTMSLSTAFAFVYWYWIELCFSKNGWYPYPLFAILSTAQRVILFTFAAVLVTASSGMLKWMYAWVNGYPTKPLRKMQ